MAERPTISRGELLVDFGFLFPLAPKARLTDLDRATLLAAQNKALAAGYRPEVSMIYMQPQELIIARLAIRDLFKGNEEDATRAFLEFADEDKGFVGPYAAHLDYEGRGIALYVAPPKM